MNIIPNNIYKGRNSDGSSFRIEGWDFTTLSNLELGGQLIMLVICMVLVSTASPILTILAIIGFSGRFSLIYVLSILLGLYFLYDCSQGWLGVQCLSFFVSESVINLFIRLNIASVIISTLLMLFGGVIRNLIANPITKYDEDAYFLLPKWVKEDAEYGVQRNKIIFYLVITIVIMASFVIGGSYIPKQKGWVKNNVNHVSSSEREQAREDSLKQALGDFKTQEERDAHFRELEERY